MVWYDLKVGTFNLKITPLNPVEKEFPNCDKDGKPLKKVAGKYERGYFENEKGERFDVAFKLINGKPFAKLSKTKETKVYKEVDVKEVDDIIQEKIYLVECDDLYNELKETGKALLFGYTSGNGYKVYKAYIRPSELYQGFCFMVCGTTQISELMQEITETIKQKEKLKTLTLTIQGVDKARVEDLITL